MKQRIIFLPILCIVLLGSCKSDSTVVDGKNADTIPGNTATPDDSFCKAWKSFPNSFPEKDFKIRFDVPLDVTIVEECIREYKEKLGATPPDITNVMFSYYVAFDTKKVQAWLTSGSINHSDQLRMEFGIYSQAAIDMSRTIYPSDPSRQIPSTHLNKTTVFISPYKSGSRATDPSSGNVLEPFNLGSLHP